MPLLPKKRKAEIAALLMLPLTSTAGCSRKRILIVVILTASIGLADFFTGTQVSLTLFYLIPVSLCVAWFGLKSAALLGLGCVSLRITGDLLQGATYLNDTRSAVWNALIHFFTYLVVALVLRALIQVHRELEERVRTRTADLQRETAAREQLQRELLEISARERRSVGNDLHDGLGQHLTAMAYAAQILARQLAERNDPSTPAAREIVRLAEEGITQSRQLARGLLLGSITMEAFNRELEELAASAQKTSGIVCQCQIQGDCRLEDDSTATHLFRIAQEATRNAIRHGRASEIMITLQSRPEAVVLIVADNGEGMPEGSAETGGMGLRVMAHRARLIGGDFDVDSGSDLGTRVTCIVPSRREPEVFA